MPLTSNGSYSYLHFMHPESSFFVFIDSVIHYKEIIVLSWSRFNLCIIESISFLFFFLFACYENSLRFWKWKWYDMPLLFTVFKWMSRDSSKLTSSDCYNNVSCVFCWRSINSTELIACTWKFCHNWCIIALIHWRLHVLHIVMILLCFSVVMNLCTYSCDACGKILQI